MGDKYCIWKVIQYLSGCCVSYIWGSPAIHKMLLLNLPFCCRPKEQRMQNWQLRLKREGRPKLQKLQLCRGQKLKSQLKNQKNARFRRIKHQVLDHVQYCVFSLFHYFISITQLKPGPKAKVSESGANVENIRRMKLNALVEMSQPLRMDPNLKKASLKTCWRRHSLQFYMYRLFARYLFA